jgi:hypothetical protein
MLKVFIKAKLGDVVNIINKGTYTPINSIKWYPKRRLFLLDDGEYEVWFNEKSLKLMVRDGRVICDDSSLIELI